MGTRVVDAPALGTLQRHASDSWQAPRSPPDNAHVEGDALTHQGSDRREVKPRAALWVAVFAWSHEGTDKRLTYSYCD